MRVLTVDRRFGLRSLVVVMLAAMMAGAAGALHGAQTVRASGCQPSSTPVSRVRMTPQPIATFGSLQGGQSAVFSAIALNSTGLCISGATLSINATGGPGTVTIPSAQCGGSTQLSSSAVSCTTDTSGAVVMTLTAPATIPSGGSLEVNAQGGIATGHDFYLYEYLYRFSLSPIAASGSLAPGQSVPMTLQVSGPDGTPMPGVSVQLLLTSTASGGGAATANGSPLTSTQHKFTTNSLGQVLLVYSAPLSLPGSGIDTITAESSATTPAVINTTSYAFQAGYPAVSVGDVAQVDGDNHPDIPAVFDVTLSAPQSTAVTVQYTTVCGIGDKGCREDYLQVLRTKPGTVTIPAGQVSAQVTVNVYSYAAQEAYPETFFIQLQNPAGAVLGRSLGAGTIIQDDETTLAEILYVGDTTVARSSSGNQTGEFSVTLSSPSHSDVTFTYSTSDGSALAGLDYTAVSGTGTIPAGSTSFHIAVPILPGASPASPIQYTVTIGGATGAVIERSVGTGTIV